MTKATSLVRRGEGRWTAVVNLGYSEPDPITGKRKALQRAISLGTCTRAEARVRRDEVTASIQRNEP